MKYLDPMKNNIPSLLKSKEITFDDIKTKNFHVSPQLKAQIQSMVDSLKGSEPITSSLTASDKAMLYSKTKPKRIKTQQQRQYLGI